MWILDKAVLIAKITIGIVVVSGIAWCSVALKQSVDIQEDAWTTRESQIVMIKPSEAGYSYTIFLNKYGNETWSRGKIVVNIDPIAVSKGAPKAKFRYNTLSQSMSEFKTITITFHDIGDVGKFMGGNTMNVTVQSGRDSNVAIASSSSTSNACFIAALGGS